MYTYLFDVSVYCLASRHLVRSDPQFQAVYDAVLVQAAIFVIYIVVQESWISGRYVCMLSVSPTVSLSYPQLLSFPYLLPLSPLPPSPYSLDLGMAHILPHLGDISTFIYFLCLELFLLFSAFAVYPIFMVGH